MANKISVILDIATDKAVSGLKGFKNSVADADGAVNKFKAGAGSAFDSIKGQAGNLAMVAGAAIVTFGVKAVAAFQDTALAAGKLADATGLSTEEASKWVAVADDIGISSESMEKSFGKLAQSIGKNNPLLEQYGIVVQRGADGQADMNATMLHAIDVIRSVEDPTKKAALAQAALGKGWMDMAELIEQGSGTLVESMANVSEAQVIDPKEVEKARKMRESMDNLQDSVRDVALVVGEDLVPAVAMLAEGLVVLIKPLSAVHQWSNDLAFSFGELIGVIDKGAEVTAESAKGIGMMGESLKEFAKEAEQHIEFQEGMKAATAETTEATEEADVATKSFTGALQENADATNDARDARRSAADATFALHDAELELAASLSTVNERLVEAEGNLLEQRSILEGVTQDAIAVADAQVRIAQETATASGSVMTAKQQADLYRSSLELQAAQLSGPSKQALLDYIATLDAIPTDINTNVRVTRTGDTLGPLGPGGQRAAGGPVSSGQTYLVGEEGPELVTMGGHGYVTPNSALNGNAGGLTVNINGGLIDQRTIEQIAREWDRWKRGMS